MEYLSDYEKDEKDEMTWWIVLYIVDEKCCMIWYEYGVRPQVMI